MRKKAQRNLSVSCAHCPIRKYKSTKHKHKVSLSLLDMSSWELQLVETAEEELEILRTRYPDRFAYLKSDLESFISHLREEHEQAPPLPSSSILLTQESSNCQIKQKHKKRKCMCISHNIRNQSSSSSSSFHNNCKKMDVRSESRREDRSEMVLQRAQICLHKIRQLKASLSSSLLN